MYQRYISLYSSIFKEISKFCKLVLDLRLQCVSDSLKHQVRAQKINARREKLTKNAQTGQTSSFLGFTKYNYFALSRLG